MIMLYGLVDNRKEEHCISFLKLYKRGFKKNALNYMQTNFHNLGYKLVYAVVNLLSIVPLLLFCS
jgi:hypothetical protein